MGPTGKFDNSQWISTLAGNSLVFQISINCQLFGCETELSVCGRTCYLAYYMLSYMKS